MRFGIGGTGQNGSELDVIEELLVLHPARELDCLHELVYAVVITEFKAAVLLCVLLYEGF